MRERWQRVALGLAGVAWMAVAGVGLRALALHEGTAGAQKDAPARWPGDVSLSREPGRAALVVTLHPACPCSRATVAELERLMARTADRLTASVLFVVPEGLDLDPRGSDMWARVSATPGARAIVDPGGRVARRFGALTSGQVVLFDSGGLRLFQGGLTASRAHEGDNQGREAVESLVAGRPALARTDVFGCPLAADGGAT